MDADVMEGRFYLLELAEREYQRKGQDAEHAQRQLRIDGKDHDQREAEIQDIFING